MILSDRIALVGDHQAADDDGEAPRRRAATCRRGRPPAFLAALALTVTAMGAGCGGDTDDTASIIRVPGDHATIQQAVDAARPGDLVLIAAGTYSEAVTIRTERLTLRGADRNTVVLDGGDRLVNGIAVEANGVSVENLTIHSYRQNGLLFNGAAGTNGVSDQTVVYGIDDHVLDGYRASYVTSFDNGLYGLYAFASRNGLIEHSYASGHPDSGIYIGQCSPCNVVVDDVTAEKNAIGYYGTNASGAVYVVRSTFRHNRLGMTPNSQKMERLSPQVETFVAGNLVTDNDDPDTPEIPRGFFGGGIAIGGGTRNIVVRNRVTGHDLFGIGLLELNPFEPENNRVEGNVTDDNGVDLAYLPGPSVTTTKGNCFVGNTFSTSEPPNIETAMACTPGGDVPYTRTASPVITAPKGVDYRDVPAPPGQPSRPGDPAEMPAAPAGAPTFPDIASIEVPDA